MKTLYFVRHAKSSWEHVGLSDHDRPLNSRGERDAPVMANLLKNKGIQPDALVSSTANRAFSTAAYFATAFGLPVEAIVKKTQLYEATEEAVMQVVHQLPAEWHTVFIFGHNPTFTDVANAFNEGYIDNVPTCGVFKVEANVDDWRQVSAQTAQLTEFYYPKQYFN